jgi:hypothetical protein
VSLTTGYAFFDAATHHLEPITSCYGQAESRQAHRGMTEDPPPPAAIAFIGAINGLLRDWSAGWVEATLDQIIDELDLTAMRKLAEGLRGMSALWKAAVLRLRRPGLRRPGLPNDPRNPGRYYSAGPRRGSPMRIANVIEYVLPPMFVLAGLGFAAVGWHVIRTGRRLKRYGRPVPGTVVKLRWQSNDHGGGSFYPLLRFHTADGTVVETESDLGANPAPARAGQQVTVVYDPAKPRRARMASMMGSGAVHGPLFLAFGILVTIVAVAVTFVVLF